MTESEVWKDILGYEGFYKVSNKGNIYSVERRDTLGRKIGGRTLRPTSDTHGYHQIGLCKNGIEKKELIHKLVAQAFIPNQNNYLEINHKDENKTNNHVENLEWCTREHNNNYGTRNERLSKKVRAVNVETGEVITFNSTQEAGCKGYNQGHVSRACRGVYKTNTGKLTGDGRTYKGYRWSYEEVVEK